MKARKTVYASPKLEIVPFDEEDILTVSTWGENEGDNPENPGGGGGAGVDYGDLGWT